MPVSKISQLVQQEAEAAKEAAFVQAYQAGLDKEEADVIAQSIALAEAEKKVAEFSVASPGARKFVLQEFKIDQFNIKRRYVELTPSMCRERNCPFDASRAVGFVGWDDERFNKSQALPNGRTLEQAVLGVLDAHLRNYHVMDTSSHILTEEELKKRQWTNVPAPFLTSPGR